MKILVYRLIFTPDWALCYVLVFCHYLHYLVHYLEFFVELYCQTFFFVEQIQKSCAFSFPSSFFRTNTRGRLQQSS